MVKTKDRLEKILKEYIDVVIHQFNIYAIVLFGSYAHENPREYSDIDVAVFSESFGNDPLAEMTMLNKMRRKVDTDIEPLPFSKDDFLMHSSRDFIQEILRNGKIIYKEGKILI